jgi:hypothetical protein
MAALGRISGELGDEAAGDVEAVVNCECGNGWSVGLES